MVIPKAWSTNYRPVCIHFAGTGDHNYSRRRLFLANQLIEDGIASLIIMNPFYSTRKPKDQKGSSLNFVSDLFIMGGALIMECSALLDWCEQNGYGPFALHGISMGGYMAGLCATVWPKPISLIPCLSWTSASVVFVEGILSNAVDWSVLTKQYYSDSIYSDVIRPKLQPPFPASFKADNTSEDPLEDLIRSALKSQNLSNTSNVKQSASMEMDHLLNTASSEQTSDTHVHVINHTKAHSVNSSSDSNKHLHERITPQPINISTTRQSSSSSVNPAYASLLAARRFLPNNISIGLPSSLSSINLNTFLRYPLDNSSLWHNSISLFRSLPEDISRMMSTASSPPDPEVQQFLRDLLDFFTHLGNFSPILDSRLVLPVAAECDAYVPRHGVCSLTKIYPNAEIRILPQSGHVGAYVRNAIWTNDFRQAITDCLNRQVHLYHDEPGPFGRNKKSALSNNNATTNNSNSSTINNSDNIIQATDRSKG
ncbi:unnamed protein product [Trichobilharzia szidati]|nr:unnamed protein product [Trichobilharzia szidati]